MTDLGFGFAGAVVRRPKRLRLIFSGELSSGAFVTTWYTVASLDGLGPSPSVLAALAVPGFPEQVELDLLQELVGGAKYRVDVAAGLPIPGDVAGALSFQLFVPLISPSASTSVETSVSGLYATLFGTDFLWSGDDWVENAEGDLQEVSGLPNVTGALQRRIESESGLLWDPEYGARAREFVDAPTVSAARAGALYERQLILDDRVAQATSSVGPDDGSGQQTIDLKVVLTAGVPVNISTQAPQPA